MGWEIEKNEFLKINSVTSRKIRDGVSQIIRFHFDPTLSSLYLGKDQILKQSISELRASLERVNDALRSPDSFGSIKVLIGSDGILTISRSDYNFEIGIAPTLLERKKIILDRIYSLTSAEKIETINALVDEVKDEDVKLKIEEQIEQFNTENQYISEQKKEVENDVQEENQKTQSELARLSVEMFERRSKVWFSLLERGSAATIIGALILVIILSAQVAAIFTKIPTPEILNNAFLIILGYFFGQSTNSDSSSK
jgi:hypothetical protein